MSTPTSSPAAPRSATAFPVDDILPELFAAFSQADRVCLQAPPGTGKTTRIPPALLAHDGQAVLMLEPRRLAARAAARYMAAMRGEPAGRSVGYRVRMDSKVSAETRITVVTEGVLTRLLRADPELSGIGWLVFDEFHERHLQGDTGLALALDCQETLRDADNPLRILVMSATLESGPLVRLLGDCPLVHTAGTLWPVETSYLPALPHERTEAHMMRGLRSVFSAPGSVLAFLPGEAEIRRVRDKLVEAAAARLLPDDLSVHPLYGDLPPAEQDAAIVPPPPGRRKLVLATSIAESSLTIEGVRVVVDAGLARSPRFDPGSGMGRLVTQRVSLSAAEQRRGRAGRLEPGLCVRLWDQGEEAGFRAVPRPEILDADLADLRLELALWGIHRPENLRWLDMPPAAAWEQATKLLLELEALRPSEAENGPPLCTDHGRAMAALPLHPRLAHMLIRSKKYYANSCACLLAVLMEERDPLRGTAQSVDLRLRLEWLARRPEHRLSALARRLERLLPQESSRHSQADPELAGTLLALAYPERVAQHRGNERGLFRLANGRGGWMDAADPLADAPYLAVGEVDGNGPDCRIFQAAPLDEALLRELFAAHITSEQHIRWDHREEIVTAREQELYAALILRDASLSSPAPAELCAAQLEGFRKLGLEALPWTPDLLQWRARVQFLRARNRARPDLVPDYFPDLTDATLLDTLEHWLLPIAPGMTRRSQWRNLDLRSGLLLLFPPHALHAALRVLDKEAPERLTVPSGSSIRLKYNEALLRTASPIEENMPEENPPEAPPVLAVKLQELFGLTRTPEVTGVPVLVHLLSPAGRPLQVTRDLAGFWKNGYPAVRAEMRGRYPRHPWPDNPLEAAPTKRTKHKISK